ncbi:Porin type [Trema orientale]|uniref:Porin type n=1 Tax=Trema orientale TaxID=63057 RepID=A0A2P5FDM1_TREOI|nr:Porin type [Trema orientale]
MGKGPGLYTDIGKKARDLLYKDYQTDHKFTITTYSPTGVAITSTGIKKGELFLADVNTQLKNKNITTDIKVDTSSNLIATVTVDEPAPGLKTILSFRVPDQSNDKGDSVSGSYYHTVNAITNTAVGAEATHSFSTNENTFTVGTQHALDPLTTVKARVNNLGRASALIQHEWRPKSFFTISGDVDTKAIEKSAKVGLALALKP